MRELTKAERHEVYKLSLNKLNDFEAKNFTFYMCNELESIIKRKFDLDYEALDLVEFADKKPEEGDCYVWFDRLEDWKFDYESRRKVLTQCIEETKP